MNIMSLHKVVYKLVDLYWRAWKIMCNILHTSHSGISPWTASSPSYLSCRTLVHATWFRSPASSFSSDGIIVGAWVATFVTIESRGSRFLAKVVVLPKENPSLLLSYLSETIAFDDVIERPILEENAKEAMKLVNLYEGREWFNVVRWFLRELELKNSMYL